MPSHSIHRLLAQRYLDVSADLVSNVDQLIDLGPIHDIGRRMPRKPPAYLDIIEQGIEEKLQVLERSRKAYEILNKLLSSIDHAKVFFFHHGLDILSYRVASALTLGLDLEKACGGLVKGTILDLETIVARINRGHVFDDIRYVIEHGLMGSCRDEALVGWVRATLIPEYEKYKSLSFLQERLLNSLNSILEADAKYHVGVLLGLKALSAKHPRVRVVLDSDSGDRDKISRSYIEDVYREELKRRVESLRLSPYGIGRIRKLVVKLAALYSDLYHLAYVNPLPIKTTTEELLSSRKKKYSLMKYVFDCFKTYRGDSEAIKRCIMSNHLIDNRLQVFTPKYMERNKINEIKERMFEALDYLVSLLSTINVDILGA